MLNMLWGKCTFLGANVKNMGPVWTYRQQLTRATPAASLGSALFGFLCHGFTSWSMRLAEKCRKSEVMEWAGNTLML